MLEEKYQIGPDYIARIIVNKISNFFLSYPEFMFMGKILIALVVMFIVFFLLIGFFKTQSSGTIPLPGFN